MIELIFNVPFSIQLMNGRKTQNKYHLAYVLNVSIKLVKPEKSIAS